MKNETQKLAVSDNDAIADAQLEPVVGGIAMLLPAVQSVREASRRRVKSSEENALMQVS